ncbi:hypothetical protein C8R47DRAFT_1265267 [Mycena vitilis]|nr:hypothetical protein C8R47DRAFT_1265267 [Mycena vitilis]
MGHCSSRIQASRPPDASRVRDLKISRYIRYQDLKASKHEDSFSKRQDAMIIKTSSLQKLKTSVGCCNSLLRRASSSRLELPQIVAGHLVLGCLKRFKTASSGRQDPAQDYRPQDGSSSRPPQDAQRSSRPHIQDAATFKTKDIKTPAQDDRPIGYPSPQAQDLGGMLLQSQVASRRCKTSINARLKVDGPQDAQAPQDLR